jgi:hypothetical protein
VPLIGLGKDELVTHALAFESDQNPAADGFKEFKLSRPPSLLLDDNRAWSNQSAASRAPVV